jgi:predicted MFS family arabinose efflux permease
LIAGSALALPVPVLIAVAPSWGWIVAANILLGINQGLAWSMTVVMKIDLVGPRRRASALPGGLVPLFLAAHGAGAAEIGLVAAIYPGVWSVGQIATGHWSDHVGRKPLIVAGMLVQAVALALLAVSDGDVAVAGGAIGLVAALTAASGVWVLVDMPGERSPAAGSWTDGR